MLEADIRRFIEEHTGALVPLFIESRLASWEASTTGTAAANERAVRAETTLRRLYADPESARRVRKWLQRKDMDPLTRRQLVILDHAYTENGLPPETIDDLVRRAQDIEAIFNTFRGIIDDRPATNNEIVRILRTSADSGERRAAWEASKQIGARAAEPLRELARRRNAAARCIGFRDYYAMRLALEEIREDALLTLCGQLRELTEPLYTRLKGELDAALAARFRVTPAELRPHHYPDPFFQEVPPDEDLDLDRMFQDRDIVAIGRDFFAGIGLPVEPILERSDLYEREGKDQHAYCVDIDRCGDVRVLCNVVPSERWMQTVLHELGHATYDYYMPLTLPFLLHRPAHLISTEAIALLFGRLTRDAAWLTATVHPDPDTARTIERALPEDRRRAMLIFARWALVMVYFEREFYADPDRDDLTPLWWKIVGELQKVRPPENVETRHDWATKIHLATAPVYYHNYLLGELQASQLAAYICDNIVPAPHREPAGYLGRSEIGEYLREHVFAPGASLTWNELSQHATGQPLSPESFIREFIAEPPA
ncbi:MAG: M2 family metallopeptidase [Gemmatimonadetes bacterium]|nr:M2 family metallopeptidase [Gemmatimonadota bacterium]